MPTKVINYNLTEPRRALQPKGTQWFPWIGHFVVQAISLGPRRRPIEFLTSSHPFMRLSKISNSQIHKVKKWKNLSHFRHISIVRRDLFLFPSGNFYKKNQPSVLSIYIVFLDLPNKEQTNKKVFTTQKSAKEIPEIHWIKLTGSIRYLIRKKVKEENAGLISW